MKKAVHLLWAQETLVVCSTEGHARGTSNIRIAHELWNEKQKHLFREGRQGRKKKSDALVIFYWILFASFALFADWLVPVFSSALTYRVAL